MKISAVLILLCASFSLQGQVIKGVVKNKVSGQGIAFLNLGVEGTRVGTFTEKTGQFELTIPEDLRDRQLTLYGLGYQRKDISISTFNGKGQLEIFMEPVSVDLGEVTVDKKSSGYVSKELLTAKRKAMQRAYRALSPKNPEHSGTTIASLVDVPEPHFVLSASVFVAETTTDSLKFRLRLFDVDPETGLPGKDLLMNSEVQRFKGEKGWMEIDIEDKYLFLDKQAYFLGFELIEEKAERYRVYNARRGHRERLVELHRQGVKGIDQVEREVDGAKRTDYRISLSPKKMKKYGLALSIFTTKFEMVPGKGTGVYRSSSFENWTKSDLGVFRMKLKYEYENDR